MFVPFFLIGTIGTGTQRPVNYSLFPYKASHGDKLFSSLAAEVFETNVTWTVERRVQRTVILTVDVDKLAQVNMRIALRHHQPLLFIGVLDEAEVVFAVASNNSIKVSTYRHATRFTRNQFQVNIQMRVWIEVFNYNVFSY